MKRRQWQPRHFILIVTVVQVFLMFQTSLALSANDQPFNTTDLNSDTSYTAFSTAAPFSKAIQNSNLSLKVSAAFPIIEAFAQAIDQRISDQHARACNLYAINWFENLVTDTQLRQLYELNPTCRTRLDATDARLSGYLNNSSILHNIHRKLSETADTIAKVINESASMQLPFKTNPYSLCHFSISRGSQQCDVHSIGAFRRFGNWYLRLAVTNSPVDSFAIDESRMIVEEFTDLSFNNVLRSVHVTKDSTYVNASTVYTTLRGKAPFSIVSMSSDENAAIVEALRLTELAVNQAEDAITPSNLAILAFPLILTFVPVAFTADLNTCATLVYILFTDIFSTLPLLIKGIELFFTGSQSHGESSAFHVGDKKFGWLEIWSVQCQGSNSFVVYGIVLIAISVSAGFVGISLEILSWRIMSERRKANNNNNEVAQGPFGSVYQSDSWLNLHPIQENDYEESYLDGDSTTTDVDDFNEPPIGSWGLRLLQRGNSRSGRKRLQNNSDGLSIRDVPLLPLFSDSSRTRNRAVL